MGQTVSLIGSSGLVGSQILDLLLKDDRYSSVNLLVRKEPELKNPKIRVVMMDFADEKAYAEAIRGSEAVFCAVGTTNKKVKGDKDEYRKVDFDIPVFAARAAAACGCYSFGMVSAIGANPDNNANFYLKLKGVTEEAVAKEHVPQVLLLRPSMLLGDRRENRIGESIGKGLATVISPLLFGSAKKYKAISAHDVAAAMLAATQQLPKGIHVLEYSEMKKLISGKQ
jgi:uncharacterized protein YbjT (DUF2867 family)